MIGHLLIFVSSILIIWFFAGILIDSISRIAKKFNKRGFMVAFFALGLLTSISEISVALNSSIENVPQISAGNLAGASLVLLFFAVPILAILGGGITLRHIISTRNLQLSLITIAAPTIMLVDGDVTRLEGILMIIMYLALVVSIRGQKKTDESLPIETPQPVEKFTVVNDFLKVIFGGICIFIAGHFLVVQSSYIANWLGIPGSIVGLLLLSIGTNAPELVIAARSIFKKRKEIAFGDYIGSAAMNTLIFGFTPFMSGKFAVDAEAFTFTSLVFISGLIFFYSFACSKYSISKKEGLILILFYVAFIATQLIRIIN